MASTQVSKAVATMTIDDLATVGVDVTITDGGFGDMGLGPGSVVYVGALGVWTLNVDTGTTKPFIGSSFDPAMDLGFVNMSSAAGTLVVEWSDDGFTGPVPSATFQASIGGTTAGTIRYESFYSAANSIPALTALTDSGVLLPGLGSAFAASDIGSAVGLSVPPGFALTQRVTITHTGAGLSSGDAELNQVPDGGSTLVLLGSVLSGIGALALRRKQA